MIGRISKLPFGGVSGTTLCTLIGLLSGTGAGVILARSLGPSGRGELAAAVLWPSLVVLAGDLGLGFSLSWHFAKFRDRLDDLWTFALAVGSSVGFCFLLFGWWILPSLLPSLALPTREAMRIAMLSVPIRILTSYMAFMLLGAQFVADYNFVRLSVPVANFLTILMVEALGHPNVRSYAIAYVVSFSCGLLFTALVVVMRLKPGLRFTTDLAPGLFSYGFKTHVSSLAFEANSSMDQTVMSIFSSPQQLGQYSIAVTIGSVLVPFFNALSIVILPRASNAANKVTGALLTMKQVKFAGLVSIPVLLASLILIPWVLPAIFGAAYGPAVLPAQILLLAGLFQGMNLVFANSLRGSGHPGLPAIAQAVSLVLTIGLLYTLLPPFGIIGAAVASGLAYSAATALLFMFVGRSAGLSLAALASVPVDLGAFARPATFIKDAMKRPTL